MIKFEIKSRWTGKVKFTAEIECSEDTHVSVKLGLAVKWAIKSGADLSGANLRDTNLRDTNLRDADLRGADLRGANLSDADLSGANLSGADLSGANLRDAHLRDANLRDTNLRDTNLRDANLRDANLRDAHLSGANLRDCPVKIENIHGAVYEAAKPDGALEMGSWHCGTAHCRAGWVVTLAGEGGKALEFAMGTAAAAASIYLASDPKLEKMPDFYTDNETALADMKRLAEAEAA